MKKILLYLLGGIIILSTWFTTLYVNAQSNSAPSTEQQGTSDKKECKDWCCWVKLNTNFPIVWNCITFGEGKNETNSTNVFQKMVGALTKITMSVILVVCFVIIIIAWIMRAWAGEDSSQRTKAKKLIEKVAITILLIWFSWVILRLINPNFFG